MPGPDVRSGGNFLNAQVRAMQDSRSHEAPRGLLTLALGRSRALSREAAQQRGRRRINCSWRRRALPMVSTDPHSDPYECSRRGADGERPRATSARRRASLVEVPMRRGSSAAVALVGPAHVLSEVSLVDLRRQTAQHEVVAVHILTCTHGSTLRTGARCPVTARLLDSANTDPMTACTCRRWVCLGATPTPGGMTHLWSGALFIPFRLDSCTFATIGWAASVSWIGSRPESVRCVIAGRVDHL